MHPAACLLLGDEEGRARSLPPGASPLLQRDGRRVPARSEEGDALARAPHLGLEGERLVLVGLAGSLTLLCGRSELALPRRGPGQPQAQEVAPAQRIEGARR